MVTDSMRLRRLRSDEDDDQRPGPIVVSSLLVVQATQECPSRSVHR